MHAFCSGKTKRSLSGSTVCTADGSGIKVSKKAAVMYIRSAPRSKPRPSVQSGKALLSRGQEMEMQSLGSDFCT